MDSPLREPSPDSGTIEKPHRIPFWHGSQGYTRKTQRSLTPPRRAIGAKPLFVRGVHWILPWSIADYPGIQRGTLQLFGGRVALETVRSWRKGYRGFPAWAALALAEAIEVRVLSGLDLITELRAYAAERANRPKSGPGFRKVDPVTGMDGRSKIGRRKAKEV
jgi:hypothetical protein